MSDPDRDPDLIAERAADAVRTVSARAGFFVTWILALAALIVVGSFWAGVVALDGGARTVWIVLGVVFGWIALSGLARVRWNLGVIRRHADGLVHEVRALLESDPSSERRVIEAIEVGESQDSRVVMTFSKQFSGLGASLGPDRSAYRVLPRVVDVMRTGLVAVAKSFGIALVFGFFGLIFLLALAISR